MGRLNDGGCWAVRIQDRRYPSGPVPRYTKYPAWHSGTAGWVREAGTSVAGTDLLGG